MRLQQRANDTLQKVAKVRTRVIFLVGKPELNAHAMGPAFIVRMAGTFPTMVTGPRPFVISRGWILGFAESGIGVHILVASFVRRSIPGSGVASDWIDLAGLFPGLVENDADVVKTARNGDRGRT